MRRARSLAVVVLLASTATARAEQYVFSTLDSGDPPTAEQNAFCDDAFGARSATVVSRLNARRSLARRTIRVRARSR